MKRLVCAVLAAALLAGAAGGCGKKKEAVDVALIISEPGGFTGNNFNRGAWEGLSRYCEEKGLATAYYEPENRNQMEYEAMIKKAVDLGAQVLVLPGYLFEITVLTAQDQYPDINFILLDGVPNNGDFEGDYQEKISSNTYSVMYAEEQAGFLVGYGAVMEGLRKLGFFGGMSVPAVTRFGYGYIQGAEYAAAQLELPADSVELRYVYCGSFSPSPTYQAHASEWYHDGTQVIFACGGAMGESVIQAAESADGWAIGVDTDQSEDSPQVLTSALKMIADSVYDAVKRAYEGNFPGGQSIHLGAEVGGVGLPMETSRFQSFDQAQYQEIFQTLSQGEIPILKDDAPIEEIPLTHVQLVVESFR